MFDYSDQSQKQSQAIREAMLEKPARKIKIPKTLAVVDQSGCTGCEACVQFCPVDCIELVPGPQFPDMNKMVEIDLDRCIGCKLCAKHCPWDTIHMIPNAECEDRANEWTLRSVIKPEAVSTQSIWPKAAPTAEATETPAPTGNSE